ncbi:hypothetical protein [Shewanella hanedai]|nr:hypothetical protein [Shewanella hanedai]
MVSHHIGMNGSVCLVIQGLLCDIAELQRITINDVVIDDLLGVSNG